MALVIADRIKETTTTTGTGALTLLGAMTGFRAFSAKCSVGDTCYYAIQAVDSVGSPTGDWECGLGTYSSVNTLTRTTVTSSSNSDSAVNFSAGTKQVYICVPAAQAAWTRERLTADRTYYVATTGSDTSDGRTVSTPLLTIQKAVDIVAKLDLNGNSVTISVADGTYTAGVSDFKSPVGEGSVYLTGNVTTPSSCLISLASGDCITASTYSQAKRYVTGFKVTSSSGSGLVVRDGAFLSFANIDFGACGLYQMHTLNGAILTAYGNYAVSGSAAVHLFAIYGSVVNVNTKTVTITGTPSTTYGFVVARQASMVSALGMTFSGTATGPRYEANTCGVIFVNGAASTYFPGSVSGATATGGQYS